MNSHPTRWIAGVVIFLAFVLAFALVNISVSIRSDNVRACERGRADRAVQRAFMKSAEYARLADAADREATPQARAANLRTAVAYHAYADELTGRIDPPFRCVNAYPKVEVLGIDIGADIPPRIVRPIPLPDPTVPLATLPR